MVNYLLISFLLSIIGGGLYFTLLRNRIQVLQAKYLLLCIIFLTCAVPFFIPELPNYTAAIEKEYLFDYSEYNQWNMVDIEDEELVACYATASNSEEQCFCEVKQQSDVLFYQSNTCYNFILACKLPVFWFFVSIMLLMFLDLLLKIACLVFLVKSPKKKRTLGGTTFYILQPEKQLPVPVSSFSLFKHYIIADADFENKFNKQEIEAILLHEIAHLKQRDTWQQILLFVLRIFWWMHPMYYFFRNELNRLNEYVADDFAAEHSGNFRFYAKTLLKAKEQQKKYNQLSLVLCFAQSLFKSRILRLMQKPDNSRIPHFVFALSLVAVIFYSTSSVALPLLHQQDISIKQYEVLKNKNRVTGKIEFCKSCIVEELKRTDKNL